MDKPKQEVKKEEERFHKPENVLSVQSFYDLTTEWKEAVLFNKEGEIIKHLHRHGLDYKGFFDGSNKAKDAMKKFIGIMTNPKETLGESYEKEYKTTNRYFYVNGIGFDKQYSLLRLNPPFLMFRNFDTEDGLAIVNVI